MAVGWLDVSAIAVSKRWSEFLAPLLPEMLVASHHQQQRLTGWMGLNQGVLRSLVLHTGLLRTLLDDLLRVDEMAESKREDKRGEWAAGVLDRVLGRAIVELSFQPWFEWRLGQQMIAGNESPHTLESENGVSLCSLRRAGEVDVYHVLGLVGDLQYPDVDHLEWICCLQHGFIRCNDDLDATDPSLAFRASRVFKRMGDALVLREPHEMAADSGPDFVGWLRSTHPTAATAVLDHLLERFGEWMNDGKQMAPRLKAADRTTGRWLTPHEMLRLLHEHCQPYTGLNGQVLLEAELAERLNLACEYGTGDAGIGT